jgi:hypothetical protein
VVGNNIHEKMLNIAGNIVFGKNAAQISTESVLLKINVVSAVRKKKLNQL